MTEKEAIEQFNRLMMVKMIQAAQQIKEKK